MVTIYIYILFYFILFKFAEEYSYFYEENTTQKCETCNISSQDSFLKVTLRESHK